jgi:hypothetical protein
MNHVPTSFYIQEPTITKMRMAAQCLAGRNCQPFAEHRFHVIISEEDLHNLVIEANGAKAIVDTAGRLRYIVAGTGCEFLSVPFMKGALITANGSDLLDLVAL